MYFTLKNTSCVAPKLKIFKRNRYWIRPGVIIFWANRIVWFQILVQNVLSCCNRSSTKSFKNSIFFPAEFRWNRQLSLPLTPRPSRASNASSGRGYETSVSLWRRRRSGSFLWLRWELRSLQGKSSVAPSETSNYTPYSLRATRWLFPGSCLPSSTTSSGTKRRRVSSERLVPLPGKRLSGLKSKL